VPELLVSREDHAVTLTLNRPAQRNALTAELLESLHDQLARIEADPELRVLVLRGAGGSFCAGYDLNRLTSPGTPTAGIEGDQVERVCTLLASLPLPTIAAVDGVASGAGCDLAVSCDLRIAAEGAQFAMPPARLGILYSREGVVRLRALVGPAAAKELLFAGVLMEASRALEIGLVNRVVPAGSLEAEVATLTATIAGNAPLSVRASKRLVDGASADEAAQLWRAVWMSEDAQEGPRAFRERRQPRFRGR
jgi:enoyl-CoA hydratase/carnithine racemase